MDAWSEIRRLTHNARQKKLLAASDQHKLEALKVLLDDARTQVPPPQLSSPTANVWVEQRTKCLCQMMLLPHMPECSVLRTPCSIC